MEELILEAEGSTFLAKAADFGERCQKLSRRLRVMSRHLRARLRRRDSAERLQIPSRGLTHGGEAAEKHPTAIAAVTARRRGEDHLTQMSKEVSKCADESGQFTLHRHFSQKKKGLMTGSA